MKRIILIIYTVVIAAAILFGLAFKGQIVIGLESLIPIGVMAYMLWYGSVEYNKKKGRYYYREGRLYHYQPSSFDFKYSKDSEGDGTFERTHADEEPDPTSRIFAYCMIIGAAFNIPFVALFPYGVKIGGGIVVFILSCIVGIIISGPQDRKESKKAIEEEKARQAQWKKELEEQKKREELGRWK